MSIMIYPEKMDPAAVSAHAAEIANVKDPMLASLCLITGSTLGGSKEYLTSIINAKDVEKLEYGESLCVFSPTGSDKSDGIDHNRLILGFTSHCPGKPPHMQNTAAQGFGQMPEYSGSLDRKNKGQ